ncbi:F-box only protein 9 [Pseudolycoriella hygida]|uniref:F-box only protein 9 n=1 Tax=Pseudolycoriella hygida TaxID=35572 RepID=A0A9Q0MNG3_9DIPT|nr:F-box only protein 9 [Pseudolycoriella hygida]
MNDPNRNDNDDEKDSPPTQDAGDKILEEFRQQWKNELKSDVGGVAECLNGLNESNEKVDEDKARSLFSEAVELERLGKVFEAMNLYRKAVQIVPDIEFRIYDTFKKQTKLKPDNITEDQLNANISQCDSNDESLDGVDLMERFQVAVGKTGRLFSRAGDVGVITTGLHFSDLPLEIIFYILRWVVSSELDMRSLEQLSKVSRGFYICAKDPEIWRLACLKIWGINTGDLSLYSSWREMFLYRHKVHFHGCYISKASYLRYGENSFQDQFYRPVQVIEYYRYIRFFADGCILMLTTADEPAQTVGKLKSRNPRNDVLKGHYRLHDDVVIIVLKRNKSVQQQFFKQQRRSSVMDDSNSSNQSFYLELNISSSASNKRHFNQLKWKHYAIIQGKNQVKTSFELTASKYPPLIFSRVKSYHLASESPIQ